MAELLGRAVEPSRLAAITTIGVSRPVSTPPERVAESDLRATLPLVVAGLVAATLVALGGMLAGAAVPGDEGRLWSVPTIPVSPSIDLVPALALFYGGLIGLVRSWVQLRRRILTRSHAGSPVSVMTVAAIAAVWALPLVVGPPLGSRDVYAYVAQGEAALEGYDVYREGPSVLGDHPVLAPVDPLYLDAAVVYGPAFVEISDAVAGRTTDVIGSVYWFRALAVISLVIATAATVDLARTLGRDPADTVVLTAANPLVLLHLVSGAHNEAIMLAGMMAGVAIGQRPRWRLLGIALCSLAALVKIPALVAAVFLAWPWIRQAWAADRVKALRRFAASASTIVGVVVGGSLATGWGLDWIRAMAVAKPVEAYLSVTTVAGAGIHWLLGVELAGALSVTRGLGVIVAGGLIAWRLLGAKAAAPATVAWALVLLAVFHPTTQPWYLTWGLFAMAASSAGSRNRFLMAVSAFAAFVVMPVGPHLGQVLLDSTGRATIAVAMVAMALLTVSPPTPAERRRRGRQRDDGVVSVIVPTRNEAPNVGPLVDRLTALDLGGRDLEILFVDDSDDERGGDSPTRVSHTVHAIEAAAERHPTVAVRAHHRLPSARWGGLGGAVVDGFVLASGSVAVVMDGDLQHPAETVPALVDRVASGAAGVAVASRRVPGGVDAGLTPMRRRLSELAARVGRGLFPQRLGGVQDPLSGFFAVALDEVVVERLHPDGFKILVEVLATHPELAAVEVPFTFGGRVEGTSKASAVQGFRYLGHLVDLRLRTSYAWAGAVGPQQIYRAE